MLGPPLECVVSVSGVRGVVGDTLRVEHALGLAQAFAVAVAHGGPVVLGRDTRASGPALAQAVAAGLAAGGCAVIDLGIVPTPTVAIAVAQLKAAGGIQVSASHNPAEWNALKFFNAQGRNIDRGQLDWLLACYRDPPRGLHQRWDGIGALRHDGSLLEVHRERVLAAVDAAAIRARRPTVLLDCVNGAGAMLAPRLLAALGARVVAVHDRTDLPFPRDPEPTAANLRHAGALVRAADADVGFVQDPDADRLAIIDESGRYIGEEYTLALCALARLEAAGPGAVVCANLSTSRMLDDIAARLGARVERTPVGEAHVVDAMQRHGAALGGEGNGGVIDPRVVLGRDSHIAMALVLELMARRRLPLSEIVRSIPAYAIHKEKLAIERERLQAAISQIAAAFSGDGVSVDTRDGLKLTWRDRWLHVRASGTEPLARAIAEAPTLDAARELCARVRALLGIEAEEG